MKKLHTQNEIESYWNETLEQRKQRARDMFDDWKKSKEAHTSSVSDGSRCSCGSGKLGPKQHNDGQFMGGFTVSRKCKKCGILHFFQS